MFRKKGRKFLKLPPVRNCFTLAMTNKLVVIINTLKVPKIKKILLYEMKFLVPNCSCLQIPWLGSYRPQISVLSVLCPQLNLLNSSRTKFLGTPLLTMYLIHILEPQNPASLSMLFNDAINLRLCSAFDGWMLGWMNEWVWSIGGSTLRKTCPTATLSIAGTTWDGLESNRGLCDERPVTNFLNHGMASNFRPCVLQGNDSLVRVLFCGRWLLGWVVSTTVFSVCVWV